MNENNKKTAEEILQEVGCYRANKHLYHYTNALKAMQMHAAQYQTPPPVIGEETVFEAAENSLMLDDFDEQRPYTSGFIKGAQWQQSRLSTDKWIRVETRLPENEQTVNAKTSYGGIHKSIVFRDGKFWSVFRSQTSHETVDVECKSVISWQPISAPNEINVGEESFVYQIRFKNKNDHGQYKEWLPITKEDYENRLNNGFDLYQVRKISVIDAPTVTYTAADLEAFGDAVKREASERAKAYIQGLSIADDEKVGMYISDNGGFIEVDKNSILSISIPSLLKQFKEKEGK